MICQIMVTEESGSKLAAILVYVGGKITGKAEPGYEDLVKDTLAQLHIVDGGERRVSLKDDPKAWFEALPETYNGSYLRAKMI